MTLLDARQVQSVLVADHPVSTYNIESKTTGTTSIADGYPLPVFRLCIMAP